MTTVVNQRAELAPETASPLIELRAVEKVYRTGKLEFAALRGIDLSVSPGEMVAVVGPSGSGKTTVLNMISGIDRPSAGQVIVDGADLGAMRRRAPGPVARPNRGDRVPVLPAPAHLDRPGERGVADGLRPAVEGAPAVRAGPAPPRRRRPGGQGPPPPPRAVRAASSSGWRSPGRWRATPSSSWATSRRATSTARPAGACSTCWPA